LFVPIEKRRKIIGFISAVKDDVIIVEEDGNQFDIPVKSISKANLVADFSI
jgi:ribosome maturation factor RimP